MDFYSDTEDDVTMESRATHDHVLDVTPEALAKVTFQIGFQIDTLTNSLMERRLKYPIKERVSL